jgi:hypothetical protein
MGLLISLQGSMHMGVALLCAALSGVCQGVHRLQVQACDKCGCTGALHVGFKSLPSGERLLMHVKGRVLSPCLADLLSCVCVGVHAYVSVKLGVEVCVLVLCRTWY